MKDARTMRIYLAAAAIAAVVLLAPARASAQGWLTNTDIEKTLTTYNEAGFKFLEKLDTGMWKVLYTRPGWEFGWEVIITSTSEKPEESLIVIGTTVTTTENLTSAFMMQLLDENSYDTNPGGYSIFTEKGSGIYSIQYAVKLPQTLLSETVLMEGVGFVAGYSNSRVKKLEELLKTSGAPPAENPGTQPPSGAPAAAPADSAKPDSAQPKDSSKQDKSPDAASDAKTGKSKKSFTGSSSQPAAPAPEPKPDNSNQ